MRSPIAADVLDSRKDDWTISDDSGRSMGPQDSWLAPVLSPYDTSPDLLTEKAKLTTSGLPDAYGFLRGKFASDPKLSYEDFSDSMMGIPVPMADAMGLVQYRSVPFPVPSLEADVPGFDRYEAGVIRAFLKRTDAGALDAWSGFSGLECQGLFDAILHDAGMPAGWYDFFSQKENVIIDSLKRWGGAKFTPAHEKAIRDSFIGIRSHATDGSKWDYFNKAKLLSFQILQTVAGGPKYVWNRPATNEQKVLQNIWGQLENHVNSQGKGFIASIGSAIGSGVSAVGSGLGSVGKGVIAVGKGIATPVASLVTSPIKLASDIASGKNVFQSLKDTVKRDLSSAKELAPYVQAAVSLIPGVGQGVNAAIAAGSALAQGQPITSAIVAGLKNSLPGGPIAAQAFDTTYNIARGQNVSEAALQALVNNAPGGEAGKKAAQTAIAIAKGQNIQQAAIGLAKTAISSKVSVPTSVTNLATDIASGKNVISSAQSAIGSEAMAQFKALSPRATGPLNKTGPQLRNLVKGELPSILPTDARMVAQTLLKNPSLRNLPVEDIARRLNVSTNIVRDGMGSVLQAVQKSGGPTVPSLSQAKSVASRIPMGMSFDGAMARFASQAAPKSYSHNASASPAVKAANLRRQGSFFAALSARGLDAGALDPKTMPTIRQGSTGEAVVQWQKILGVTADGKFGPQTAEATKAFQRKKNLVADGIVGPATWAAGLIQVVTTPTNLPGTTIPISTSPPAPTAPIIAANMPIIRRGSTGAAVKTWQGYLSIAADGIFGAQTEAATKAFQTKNGLVADGIVGPKTWAAAMGGTATPPVVTTPPISIPPITLPPLIPGAPPITTPPISIPPVSLPPGLPPVITAPPGMPPVVSTPPSPPAPPGQPPAPPPITTTPPGVPPVVMPPPGTPPTTGGISGNTLLVGGAVVLGALFLMGSGSRKRLV